jgi:beta-fructofuranosidase
MRPLPFNEGVLYPGSPASLSPVEGVNVKKTERVHESRRKFLQMSAVVASMAIVPWTLRSEEPTELEARLAADPERPQFHLLPARNWMNDPNGPIYFNGHYHMFFQYNPLAPTWGDMSWNHAVSPDMLHWKHLPVAMTPTPGTCDSFGVFSGSALAVGKRVYAVYTGTQHSGPDKATIRDGANNVQESQCLAWSDDPMLIRWTKDPQNPVIPAPPAGLDITGFRDPSAWKQGDWYYLTVGSGIARVGGCVLLYRSKDLKTWEYLHPLTSGEWNGIPTSNPCDDGQMWECPEFFALDGGHVLIYSTLGKVFWESGVLDESTMKFTSRQQGLLDLDAFYAPKTQIDAEGRRILWGWIPERRSEAAMRESGWSGMMSLPRVLNLDTNGTLRIRILPRTATLRSGAVPVSASRTGQVTSLRAASGEVFCNGAASQDFTFTLATDAAELMRVQYSAAKHAFTAGDAAIALEPTDQPTLHAFVDGSVIELILGQRIGYTKRFYYPGSTAPNVKCLLIGAGTLDAWKIRPISDNRLTTPAQDA